MLTFEQIKELMDKMENSNLSKIKIADENSSICLEKNSCSGSATTVVPVATTQIIENTSVVANAPVTLEEPIVHGNIVTSPIVGTFYSAPAPDKAPFVSVGSTVKKGDVLFLIESMKLMNEVTSEFDGEVVDVMTSNGQGLEFAQPVMVIR